jgi:hypothetical protein
MPSPFPGMDPYLEDPALWPSVHHLCISQIGTTLNRLLPAGYVAAFGERVISVTGDEVVEPFVEIRSATDNQHVVTAIAVLSPRNKTAGSDARRMYRQKQQREVLASDTHLLEIDLLRAGQHTVAVPRDAVARRGPYHYLVTLSRGNRRAECEVWGIPLPSPLPRVRVPLAGSDPDVVLSLQELLAAVYEAGAFERRLDYAQPPVIPLDPADAEWADAWLRQAGRRP